ncbi:MAG: diguanylate cyclase [Proteobacteria bacterium]|jgi:ribose/xylose/arabinose/galactoside ABC-type transport system permease subunit|nr:diguanylate cyclase [Alphaproteobacteria bacterium]MBL6851564.1 diguanylate cyclase [Alphaproteobacteria bacterium]MDA0916732.1 diguanylate cyclase [Pseudomonadota bacterium]
MDTVLIGGIGFLILAGISFLLIRIIDNSSMNSKNKRLFNYVILGFLVLVTIAIFKWHSSTYLIPN